MRVGVTDYRHVSPAHGGSPTIQAAQDGQRVISTVLIRGGPEHVAQAMRDFLGWSEVQVDGGTKYISRTLPHAYPGLVRPDGSPYLWAHSFQQVDNHRIEGNDVVAFGETLPSYRMTRAQITYVSQLYSVVPDDDISMIGGLGILPDESTLGRYVSKVKKPLGRMVTLPRQFMRWVPMGGTGEVPVPIVEGVSLSENGYEITYIHHNRPDSPVQLLQDGLNTVNDAEFDRHPAGTLLLRSADVKPQVQPNGTVTYDTQFIMTFLPKRARENPDKGTPRGHNWYLRWLKGTQKIDYRQLSSDGTAAGIPPYDASDFKKLFRPEA